MKGKQKSLAALWISKKKIFSQSSGSGSASLPAAHQCIFQRCYILSPLPGGQPAHDRQEELKALALDPVPVYRDTVSRSHATISRPGEVIRRLTVGRYHPAYRQPDTQSHGTGRAPGVGLGVCKIFLKVNILGVKKADYYS